MKFCTNGWLSRHFVFGLAMLAEASVSIGGQADVEPSGEARINGVSHCYIVAARSCRTCTKPVTIFPLIAIGNTYLSLPAGERHASSNAAERRLVQPTKERSAA